MVSLFFCANTAAPLSASSVKKIGFSESCFLPFSCLFCRGSVLINQRLCHFHRLLALIQTQRQIRCRTGIEQQAALEFTVAAERGQAREIGLGEGEQQSSVLLLDLRNPLLAGLGTQQRDIQQRDGLRRRLTEAVDQLVKHITALLVRSDERNTAVQIDTLPRIRNIIGGKVGRNQQFGRTIGQFQNTQFQLADMATKVKAAQMMVYRAAMAKATQKSYSVEAAKAKLYAAEVAMEVTTKAVQLHGGYGYTREYEVERMMRDAKITEIYEGTSEVQRMVISGALLK